MERDNRTGVKLREEEMLYAVMQFLRNQGYLDSFVKLERETGLRLEQYSGEIEFFRDLLVDGQFKEAEIFLELFKSIDSFPYRRCLYQLKKQNFFELIEFNDDDQKIIAIVKELQELTTKDDYKQLTFFLTLKRINDHPDFANWNALRGRLDCFELIKESLQTVYSTPDSREKIPADALKSLAQQVMYDSLQDKSAGIAEYIKRQGGEISLFDERVTGKTLDKAKRMLDVKFKPVAKAGRADPLQASIADLRMSGFASRPNPMEFLIQSMNAANLKSFRKPFEETIDQHSVMKGTNQHLQTHQSQPQQQQPQKQQQVPPQALFQKPAYNNSGNNPSMVKYSDEGDENEEIKPNVPSNYEYYKSSTEKKKGRRDPSKEPEKNFWDQGKTEQISQIEHISQISQIDNEPNQSASKFLDNPNESYQTTARRVSKNSSSNEETEKNVIIEKLLLSDTNREYSDNEELSRTNVLQDYYKPDEGFAEDLQDLVELYSIKDSNPIRAACFNSVGDAFAIGTNSKSLKLYSLTSNKNYGGGEGRLDPIRLLWEKQNHHTGSIYAIDWSRSNRFIATGSNDKTIRVLSIPDFENDTGFLELKLQGHKGIIRSLCFSSDSLELFSASTDFSIKLWDVEEGAEKLTLEGHTAAVYSIQVNYDNTFCVSVGMDRSLKVWDLRTSKCSLSIEPKHYSEMNYISLSESSRTNDSGSRLAAVAHNDGLITLWDLAYPKVLSEIKMHTADCRSVEFDAKSQYLLSASFDNTIGIYDLKQQSIKAQPDCHTDRVVLAKWHPHLPITLSTSADCTARILGPRRLYNSA